MGEDAWLASTRALDTAPSNPDGLGDGEQPLEVGTIRGPRLGPPVVAVTTMAVHLLVLLKLQQTPAYFKRVPFSLS
jgi:hypothetical protein